MSVKKTYIIDTGPIVAYLNQNDSYHEWAKAKFKEILSTIYTCQPVITEACYLLRNVRKGRESVLKLIQSGTIKTKFEINNESELLSKLIVKYSDRPMSLADACLVRMSETIADHCILTLDSDFNFYRRNGRNVINREMPTT